MLVVFTIKRLMLLRGVEDVKMARGFILWSDIWEVCILNGVQVVRC